MSIVSTKSNRYKPSYRFIPRGLLKGTGIIDAMRPNRNKEDIGVSRILITRVPGWTVHIRTPSIT